MQLGNPDIAKKVYPEAAQIQRTESRGLCFRGQQEADYPSQTPQEWLPVPCVRAALRDRVDIAGGAMVARHSRSGMGGVAPVLPTGDTLPYTRTQARGDSLGTEPCTGDISV